jgi:hypothetical protein
MAKEWIDAARLAPHDQYPYFSVLDEILFHADLRFRDYVQYRDEGPFPTRLKKWLDNVSADRDKQSLFRLLPWILFIDRLQMVSLYRDAYRRIVVPWISRNNLNAADMLAFDYEHNVRSLLRRYRLFSITQSFDNPDFLHVNDLAGLPKPEVLGERTKRVPAKLPSANEDIEGVIIFEDFVGSGRQACRVLVEVKRNAAPRWRVLFVPLIILEQGLITLRKEQELASFAIEPVLVMAKKYCLQKNMVGGEPNEFKFVRPIVESTSRRVLERYDDLDDPPTSPYGYAGSGALMVTCHNVPNNTLSLIHHRSPDWFALFRRVHSSKDSLR